MLSVVVGIEELRSCADLISPRRALSTPLRSARLTLQNSIDSRSILIFFPFVRSFVRSVRGFGLALFTAPLWSTSSIGRSVGRSACRIKSNQIKSRIKKSNRLPSRPFSSIGRFLFHILLLFYIGRLVQTEKKEENPSRYRQPSPFTTVKWLSRGGVLSFLPYFLFDIFFFTPVYSFFSFSLSFSPLTPHHLRVKDATIRVREYVCVCVCVCIIYNRLPTTNGIVSC